MQGYSVALYSLVEPHAFQISSLLVASNFSARCPPKKLPEGGFFGGMSTMPAHRAAGLNSGACREHLERQRAASSGSY